MNIINRFFLTTTICTLSTLAFARPVHDGKETCYTFNPQTNKLINKAACEVYKGYGAGGSETSIQLRGKKYHFEYSNVYNEQDDSMDVFKVDWSKNGKLVVDDRYIRDAKTLKITKADLPSNRTLYCEKAKNIDICYTMRTENSSW